MNAALDFLCGFVIENLPDSLRDRKSLLAAMLLILPTRHPLRGRVNGLRLMLEAHEQHQMELSLDFKSENPLTRLAKPNKSKSK